MAKIDLTNSGLQYGVVHGRLIGIVPDSPHPDIDEYPDGISISGTVEFTPDVTQFSLNGTGYFPRTITAHIRPDGTLAYNDNEQLYLVASNTPGMSPQGWTYTVTPKLFIGTHPIRAKKFPIFVKAGERINLASVVPIETSKGTSVTRGLGIASAKIEAETGSIIFTLEDGTDLNPVHIGSLADINIGLEDLSNAIEQARTLSNRAVAAHDAIIPIYEDVKTLGVNANKALATAQELSATVTQAQTDVDNAKAEAQESARSAAISASTATKASLGVSNALTETEAAKMAAGNYARDAQTAQLRTAEDLAKVQSARTDVEQWQSEVVTNATSAEDAAARAEAAAQQTKEDAATTTTDRETVASSISQAKTYAEQAKQSESGATAAADRADKSASNASANSISAREASNSANSSAVAAEASAVRAEEAADKVEGAINGGYVKPETGIPRKDLASDVQASLTKADGAAQQEHQHAMRDVAGLAAALSEKYVKPAGGIDLADLSDSVNDSIKKANSATQPGHKHTVADITDLSTALAGYYTKPEDGIGESDLTTTVGAALALARTASQPGHIHQIGHISGLEAALAAKYRKPDDGIPLSDLSSGVRNAINSISTHKHAEGDINWQGTTLHTVTGYTTTYGLRTRDITNRNGDPVGTIADTDTFKYVGNTLAAPLAGGAIKPLVTASGTYLTGRANDTTNSTTTKEVTDDTAVALSHGFATKLKKAEVVDSLPSVTDPDTIYFVAE